MQSRTATLSLSMDGGGGFEIWQYTSRNTEKALFELKLGDYGLFAAKIKSRNIEKTYRFYKQNNFKILNEPSPSPDGSLSFFIKIIMSLDFYIKIIFKFFFKQIVHIFNFRNFIFFK